MSSVTEYSGELYKLNVAATFLHYGSPTCMAVSSAVTFGISVLESSLVTACDAEVVLEAVHQPPLDKSIAKLALYEFSKRVAIQKEVVAVNFEMEKEVIRIWTFIGKRDKQVRRSIYTQELELMDAFPSLVFDFNVVSLEDLKSKPFLPADLQGYLIFYRNYPGG